MKLLQHSINDNIGTITFNNDEKRNALTFQLLDEMTEILNNFENNVRVVIIRAKPGSKVWSAGLFIDELPDPGEDPLPFNHPLEKVLRTIEEFPTPVIAMAEGSIWGGACDLATTCDIIIGTKNTTFAITPARLGVAYNSSGILHIIRVFGLHTAKELFYTAHPISAEKAESNQIQTLYFDAMRELRIIRKDVESCFIIELGFLDGAKKLQEKTDVYSLIKVS
jgi:methylmalonyl-CoA decarboxylase